MRLRLPGKWEMAALTNLAWGLTAVFARTLRLTEVNGDAVNHRMRVGEGQILVTWHGRTLIPVFHLRNRGIVTVVSPSRDGEIQYRVFRRFGWDAVRGSSARGALQATLGAVRHLRAGRTLALAPDGPKGPAEIAQPGALFLAVKSGCPLVPAGVSAWPSWRLKSWDSYMVPRPFSRAVIVYGEPIRLDRDASPEDLREATERLNAALGSLRARADALARNRQPAEQTA